jgi:hypothetical protein
MTNTHEPNDEKTNIRLFDNISDLDTDKAVFPSDSEKQIVDMIFTRKKAVSENEIGMDNPDRPKTNLKKSGHIVVSSSMINPGVKKPKSVSDDDKIVETMNNVSDGIDIRLVKNIWSLVYSVALYLVFTFPYIDSLIGLAIKTVTKSDNENLKLVVKTILFAFFEAIVLLKMFI